MIDRKIHEVYDFLFGNDIRWHDFREVGGDEPYYDYYYAEEGLYIIRDRIMQRMAFIEARSPLEAMEIMREQNQITDCGERLVDE